MVKYLIDVNLPYYFSVWRGEEYTHLRDLGDDWTDKQIWDHAKEKAMTIVSKDTDFSDRVLLSGPPPRVIHIRLGNLRMRDFHQAIAWRWAPRDDQKTIDAVVRNLEVNRLHVE